MNKLFCQAWSNAAELASAYQIGKAESEAAMALLQEVEPSIVPPNLAGMVFLP